MALHQTPVTETHRDLLRILVIFAAVAAVFALIVVFGAVFGAHDATPFYPFLPDPAGIALPF
jgi:hypothetical protein